MGIDWLTPLPPPPSALLPTLHSSGARNFTSAAPSFFTAPFGIPDSLGELRTITASAFRRWPQSASTVYWRVASLHDSAEFALENGQVDEARAWITEALDLGVPLLERVPEAR